MAASISCSVFNNDGLVPMRELIATSTYCVLAIWVVFVFGDAVGACGSPVNIGEDNGAFVSILLCKEVMLLSSVINAFCIEVMFDSSVTSFVLMVATDDCKLLMFDSSNN